MVNLTKTFDLLVHMRENPRKKFKLSDKVELSYQQQGKILHRAIQAFMHESGVMLENRVIQAFSGSSDLPKLTRDVFNVTNAVPNFDTLWQASFRGVPLRRGQLDWEITDVSSGIRFELIPEGGKAKFYGIEGTKVTAKVEKYGAGIGLSWEMIEGRKLYQFVELMDHVRAQLNLIWANTHYGLLATAALATAIAWQGVATDPVVSRDIATINKGYETIGNATKDKGYGDTANAPMVLYASPLLKARIMQAFRATSNDSIGGRRDGAAGSVDGQIVEYNVTPLFTWNSNIPANRALLVLPQNKIQNSVYLQELSLNERDIETLSELRTYWTAFGAIVADTDQTAELAFA